MNTPNQIADAVKKLDCIIFGNALKSVQAEQYGLECFQNALEQAQQASAYKWALENFPPYICEGLCQITDDLLCKIQDFLNSFNDPEYLPLIQEKICPSISLIFPDEPIQCETTITLIPL